MSIPRVLHFIWIDPDDPGGANPQLPEEVLPQLARWRKTHPGFRQRVWSLADITGDLGRVLDTDVGELVMQCNFAAMQADIARLAIIHRQGGVWNDLKNFPRRPFLGALVSKFDLVLCERFPTPANPDTSGTLSNSWFAAAAGNRFIEGCLREVIDNVQARRQGSVFGLTGGGVFDRVARSADAPDLFADSCVLTWQQAWREYMRRKAMHYNRGDRHWSKRQKSEPKYRT